MKHFASYIRIIFLFFALLSINFILSVAQAVKFRERAEDVKISSAGTKLSTCY